MKKLTPLQACFMKDYIRMLKHMAGATKIATQERIIKFWFHRMAKLEELIEKDKLEDYIKNEYGI